MSMIFRALFTMTEASLSQYFKLHPDPPPISRMDI